SNIMLQIKMYFYDHATIRKRKTISKKKGLK
ncbi:YbhB/YbcL family Raf kinase inhibitor-like protein, partial [Helicobacter pylori]